MNDDEMFKTPKRKLLGSATIREGYFERKTFFIATASLEPPPTP
jgi:hypothetical protein